MHKRNCGPFIRYMNVEEFECLSSRVPANYARIINTNSFNEDTLKDKLTVIDTAVTVLYKYKPLAL